MSGKPGSTNDGGSLDAARRELLARRLRGDKAQLAPVVTIVQLPPETPVAATAAQAQLLFLDEFHADSAAYHISVALDSENGFDPHCVSQALTRLIERHESLRTVFRMRDGSPEQLVRPSWSPRVERTRVTEDALVTTLRELAARPFSVTLGPLLRADLLVVEGGFETLLLTLHHLVADEWSLSILMAELAKDYAAVSSRDDTDIVLPAVSYRDYSAWQAERVRQLGPDQLAYWRDALDEVPTEFALPFDHPRPARPSLHGAFLNLRGPAHTEKALNELARSEGVTPFMAWLAAYAVLLGRYTGQDDIVIGVPAANRGLPELEGVVGLFLNTLPLRIRLAGVSTFRDLLRRVREASLGAFSNQDVPIETVVAELSPMRDVAHNPLFQVMFVLEGETPASSDTSGQWRRRQFDAGYAKFDLTLFVRPNAAGTEMFLEYATDLFEQHTAQALLECFENLTGRLVAAPDSDLGQIETLAGDALQTMIELGQTKAGTAERSVDTLSLISAWFVDTPEALAIVDGSRRLSYADLDAESGRLAAALHENGVVHGDLVGLLLPRGADALCAMIAVWRLGAAYVPLDPDYPRARNTAIISDLKASRGAAVCVVALSEAEPFDGVTWIRLESALTTDALPPAARHCAPDDFAYIIYTSGTTATPKGVCISHGNLAQSNAARFDYYKDKPERYLVVSSFAFDSSVAGIYWTLAGGQTLVVAPADDAVDVRTLADLIDREQVTHTLMLPSLYRLLLESERDRKLVSLRAVIVAGEACPAATVVAHFDALPETRLFNEYGPTEGCVWATVYECRPGDSDPVPIGRAIPGAAAYVLDVSGRPAPRGAVGELAIGGQGVSPGYLNSVQGTESSFVSDDWSDGDNARLYLSGDNVRLRVDNRLEFIGRRDDQIKLRGHRIELGEIETQLRAIPGVRDAAVILVGDSPADARLMAFIEPSEHGGADSDTVAQSLRELLPAYMQPTRIVALKALPRSPTGKVDRHQLPRVLAPEPSRNETSEPLDDVEQELADIWCQALKCDSVGRNDDFFELGGHSLLGLSVMLEIERRLKLVLPLTALFEAPRLVELALRVREGQEHAQRHVVAIRPSGSKTPVICVHGGARVLARHLDRDRPILLAFQEIADLDPELISIESMAEEYIDEIRRMNYKGPYTLIGFSIGGKIAWEMAQQLRGRGGQVAQLILCDPAQDSGVYYRRRFGQMLSNWRSVGSPLAVAKRALSDIAAVCGRRLRRVGRGILRNVFVISGRKTQWLARCGGVLLALGAIMWLAGATWMMAPGWHTAELSLNTAGSTEPVVFVPKRSGRYELRLEVDRRVAPETLQNLVLPLRERAPLDIEWRISGDSVPVAAGDVSDYLFLDYGPRSMFGNLRSLLMRDPHGVTRAYANTMGLFGALVDARGVAGFDLVEGVSYELGANAGSEIAPLAPALPRLTIRPSRMAFAAHYATVAPWLYASFALGVTGFVLLLAGWLRARLATPTEALIAGEEQQYSRLSARYHYTPYEGHVALVLPSGYRTHENKVRSNWSALVDGRLDMKVFDNVHVHADMVRGESGELLAEFVSGLLDESHESHDARDEQLPEVKT